MSIAEIQGIAATDTYYLRALVLRNGDLAAARVPDDEMPGAWHLGARHSGELVGVGSFYPRQCPLVADVAAVQLRFMAVSPAMQGRGVGRQLLDHARRVLRKQKTGILWANGRDTALDFYARVGFIVIGDGFIHEPGLPHHLIILDLR